MIGPIPGGEGMPPIRCTRGERGYHHGAMLSPLIRQALVAYRAALVARFGDRVRRVCLFGSWARGQATEYSDVDVAVVIDGLTTRDWKDALAEAANVELATELPLSPLVMSTERFEAMLRAGGIAREIARDGIAP